MYYIRWLDAKSKADWMTADELRRLADDVDNVVEEVGYLIERRKRVIVFASQHTPKTQTEQKTYGNVSIIPTKMVLSMKPVRLNQAKRRKRK